MTSKSINERLEIQATASIILSLTLVAILVGTFYLRSQMQDDDNVYSDRALHSALLEKDFASLERDAYHYALRGDAESREAFESNVTDMRQAIDEMRGRLDEGDAALIENVVSLNSAYVATVTSEMSAGRTDASGTDRIAAAGEKVDTAIEAIRDPAIAKATEQAVALASFSNRVVGLTIVLALLVGIISYVLARAIRNAIADELGAMSGVIRRVLQGDLDVTINHAERNDDVGELARAAVQLRDTTMQKRQADADMTQMAQRVGECLQRMSRGDLTTELSELSDSYSGLRTDLNTTIRQLHDTLLGVAQSANSIRVGSNEIKQASDDLASRTESHASELASTAEAIKQIAEMLSETASGAAQAREDVTDAMAEARTGGEVIDGAVAAMGEIEASTAQIEEIIAVIDNIAFQTNLLALNAGVEAARAGSSGSGFAVAAHEVRAVAQRSAEAAKDIKSLIERSSGQVSEGAGMVRKTGEVFERIIEKIGITTTVVENISSKAESQVLNIRDANQAMHNMDTVTQQNAAMVEESNAAAHNLATEADNLASIVSGFNLNSSNTQPTVKLVPAASRPEETVSQTPQKLAAQADGNLAFKSEDWSEF
ncbi:methyl-accepting chemotaxis protein [Erythrobacter sp. SCSIO 43205]|uniref:methyl-accepting chemotaxis protein n=1 Tax=Erythrobacter sp. SCSIO 43205 TaxID=2779361 RepID=UPI001CA983F3|nr:methyl-accepting chemotaxis protein [Erythrobacter sp. SCSIO 43205]UAB79287.1 methyl-accepting chemotaxis protein [Erythrobacter sp. SCSIO 43205]